MAINFTSGFETGDTSEWTTAVGTTAAVQAPSPVYSGLWAGKITSTGTTSYLEKTGITGSTTYFATCFINVHITTAPGANTSRTMFALVDGTDQYIGSVMFKAKTDGTVKSQAQNEVGGVLLGSEVNITLDTWHRIDLMVVNANPKGIIEWRLDQVVQGTFTGLSLNGAAMSRAVVRCFIDTGSAFIVFDNIALDDTKYPYTQFILSR